MAVLKNRKGSSIRRKLRSNRGETIGETLVALLISALALVMLAGAISSTANMINTSDKKMGLYYSKDAALVEHSGGDPSGNMVVTIQSDSDANIKNDYFDTNKAFETKPVVAYKVNITDTTP